MRFKNSISNLVSIYIFISIISMGIIFFLGYYHYSKKYDSNNFIRSIDTRAEYLSSSIADNLWNLDNTTIERILNVFYSRPNVIKINLTSENMNIFLPEKIGNEDYFHTIKKSVIFINTRGQKKSVESIGTLEVTFSNETEQVKSKNFLIAMFFALNGIGILDENLTKIFNHGFTTRDDGHGFESFLANGNDSNGDTKTEKVVLDSNYHLSFASQGEKALNLVKDSIIRDEPFSLIFIDVRMPPGWDGIKTIEEIFKKDKNVQMVICSAYSDYSSFDLKSKFNESIDRILFLRKPFDSQEILQLAASLTVKWDLAFKNRSYIIELEKALNEIKTLKKFIPICLNVKKLKTVKTTDTILKSS